MPYSPSLKKLIGGIERFGFSRAVSGLLRMMWLRLEKPSQSLVITRDKHFIIYFKYPSQLMPTLVVFKELFEPEYLLLPRILRPDSVFFDVGAGIGCYSVLAASYTKETIHAFEPVEENLVSIRLNLAANRIQERVQLNPVALSNEPGFGVVDSPRNLFGTRLMAVDQEAASASIPVTTLDAYCAKHGISRIDCLKIDVEGHEAAVIQGGEGLLNSGCIGVIILEANPILMDIEPFLTSRGFEYFA